METHSIQSQKVNWIGRFIAVWIIVITILIGSIVAITMNYNEYMKGQQLVVTSLILSNEDFSTYDTNLDTTSKEYKELVESMYFYLYDLPNVIGTNEGYNISVLIEASLDGVLEAAGYDLGAMHYLNYNNVISYAFNAGVNSVLIRINIVLISIIFILNISYAMYKKSLVINKDSVFVKKKQKTKQHFMLNDVKNIQFTTLNGIKITGSGINCNIKLVKNRKQIKNFIMSNISENKDVENDKSSNDTADELKKFKELLDMGVITQEEFDAKKKQLLDL